jgi:hypothetical protein
MRFDKVLITIDVQLKEKDMQPICHVRRVLSAEPLLILQMNMPVKIRPVIILRLIFLKRRIMSILT